ncbi:zinc finger, SWIM-type [Thioalkalivibrio nitratireducens DSM 14787]|uniref:Zinc finger, SWIM-type n=1 Tax=Thioalkalivibrio nitratireducens (strain DSM 14787 / UNIQEM 213 / ALEN2) TaxID=1255043 RepID=L0DZE2_THIND|nr:helix-turn-helix domain-containing protein [Thioalkalivibrio nitratireducens]AGA34954.1 zinc finger, SWIM-type [Thioalkalivibrio nitratireducens DSM 14787]
MSWNYKPYVPVARRRAKGLRHVAAMKKRGEIVEPVAAATPRGRIAVSFWGQAWCEHLESYSDFANRLPRGRTYLRNGSVLHLGMRPGTIEALVMGSELYRQSIRIDPLPAAQWEALKQRCQGRIGSLIELLQGRISGEIMAVVTDRDTGLFPRPEEIHLGCDCPDWADLCKHLAAILYGVGARLDSAPELLFTLRGVDQAELIQGDATALSGAGKRSSRQTLPASALSDVFGIDIDADDPPADLPVPAPKVPDARATDDAAVTRDTGTARKAGTAGGARTAREAGVGPTRRAARRTARKPPETETETETETGIGATPAGIRALRERLGLSRAAFAAELGVSAQTVANWENRAGTLRLQTRSLNRLRRLNEASS